MTRTKFKAEEARQAEQADRRYLAETTAYNAQKRHEGRGR